MNYSQRDPKWAKVKLGFGGTTIGGYGCFITSLGNLAGLTPIEVNNKLKKGGFFNGDLVISTEKMAKSLGLEYDGKITATTKNPRYRTIAEVDMSPAVGKQQHFVVVKEDGSIIDPWTGTIRPKGTYPLVSYRLFRKPVVVEMKIKPITTPKEEIIPIQVKVVETPQTSISSPTIEATTTLNPTPAPNNSTVPMQETFPPMQVNQLNWHNMINQIQTKNSFDAVTVRKILTGATIAMGGATLTYFAETLPTVDFGVYTGLVVAVASILINAGREFLKGRP